MVLIVWILYKLFDTFFYDFCFLMQGLWVISVKISMHSLVDYEDILATWFLAIR